MPRGIKPANLDSLIIQGKRGIGISIFICGPCTREIDRGTAYRFLAVNLQIGLEIFTICCCSVSVSGVMLTIEFESTTETSVTIDNDAGAVIMRILRIPLKRAITSKLIDMPYRIPGMVNNLELITGSHVDMLQLLLHVIRTIGLDAVQLR